MATTSPTVDIIIVPMFYITLELDSLSPSP